MLAALKFLVIEHPSTKIRRFVSSLEAENFLFSLFKVVRNYHRKQIYINRPLSIGEMDRISPGVRSSVFYVMKLTDGARSLFEVPFSLSL